MRAGDNLNARALYIYILILLNIPRKSVHFFECLESILISIYLLRVIRRNGRRMNCVSLTQSFKHIITISRVDRAWALLYRYERVRKLTSD